MLYFRFPLVFAVIALSCILALSSTARSTDKCGSLDRVIIAIRLTQTLYPELKGKEFSLQFSEGTGGPLSGPADVRSFHITIDRPQWHPPANEASRRESQSSQDNIESPLYFNFSFIDYDSVQANVGKDLGKDLGRDLVCRPLQFLNESGRDQMKEARADINAHPEWTDAQDVEAAKQHGLRFGPDKKAMVLRSIPLGKLSEFYGPLHIKNARFSVAGNSIKEPHSSFADLRWYIDAEEVGTPRALQITVESFGGRIDGISEYKARR